MNRFHFFFNKISLSISFFFIGYFTHARDEGKIAWHMCEREKRHEENQTILLRKKIWTHGIHHITRKIKFSFIIKPKRTLNTSLYTREKIYQKKTMISKLCQPPSMDKDNTNERIDFKKSHMKTNLQQNTT